MIRRAGIVYRFRKPPTATAKLIITFLLIVVVVINISYTSIYSGRVTPSHHVLAPSGKSSPGEIGPKYIRSLSDVSNSELLRFILTNGTGDISQGGRMPVKIVEPFIERLRIAEELDKTRERSLDILARSILELNDTITKNKNGENKSDNNSDRRENKDNFEENYLRYNSLLKQIKNCFLDKDSNKDMIKKREDGDKLYLSILVKRILENAIVNPPQFEIPTPPSLLLSSSSSMISSETTISSTTREHTNHIPKTTLKQEQIKSTKITKPRVENSLTDAKAQQIETKAMNLNNTVGVSKLTTSDTVKSPKSTENKPNPVKNGERVVPQTNTEPGIKPQNMSNCSDFSLRALVGRMRVETSFRNMTQVEKSNMIPDVEAGGHFRPKECIPREKTAIVIPYRNRDEHLAVLLFNLLPVLKRQGVDFTIFVVDENMPTPFNRAMLFNIGFIEANKISPFDCFIFHDVDLIPLDDRNLYGCHQRAPMHFLAGVDKFNYTLPYKTLFGGVVAFTKNQYETINGASNLYFGWGGEDDDLRRRSISKYRRVMRKNKSVGLYDMIKHDHSAVSNKKNPVRHPLLKKAVERQDIEGLNTTIYEVTSIKKHPLFTKINVDISFDRVLKTAPDYLLDTIEYLKKSFTTSSIS